MAKTIRTTKTVTATRLAEAAREEVEAGDQSGARADGTWYRSELAARVPRKYRKARALAFVVLGTGKVVRLGAAAGGRQIAARRQQMAARVTEDPRPEFRDAMLRPPRTRRFRMGGVSATCMSCGAPFGTFEELNDHLLLAHDDDVPQVKERERPSAERVIHRSPSTRKVRVRRPVADSNVIPLRRHGVTRRTPEDHRAVAVLAKYRDKINEVGAKAMTDNEVARSISRAATDLAQQNPQGRTEMYGQVAGIEQALDALREAVERYQQGLKRDYRERKAIAPELVDPYFRRISEALESASQGAAQYVANFEAENAAAIRLAQQKRDDGGQKFLAN